MYARSGDLAKAIDDFSVIIRARPDHPDAYKFRGEAERELGRTDDAIRDLRRATELDPSDSKVAETLRTLAAEAR